MPFLRQRIRQSALAFLGDHMTGFNNQFPFSPVVLPSFAPQMPMPMQRPMGGSGPMGFPMQGPQVPSQQQSQMSQLMNNPQLMAMLKQAAPSLTKALNPNQNVTPGGSALNLVGGNANPWLNAFPGGIPFGSGSWQNSALGGSGSLNGADVGILKSMFGSGMGAGVSSY